MPAPCRALSIASGIKHAILNKVPVSKPDASICTLCTSMASSSADARKPLAATRTHEEVLGLRKYKIPDDLKEAPNKQAMQNCAKVLRAHEIVEAREERAEGKRRKVTKQRPSVNRRVEVVGSGSAPDVAPRRPQHVPREAVDSKAGVKTVVYRSRGAHNERELECLLDFSADSPEPDDDTEPEDTEREETEPEDPSDEAWEEAGWEEEGWEEEGWEEEGWEQKGWSESWEQSGWSESWQEGGSWQQSR